MDTRPDIPDVQVARLFEALRATVEQEIAMGTLTQGKLNTALAMFLGDMLGWSAYNTRESRQTIIDDTSEIAQQATAIALQTYDMLHQRKAPRRSIL